MRKHPALFYLTFVLAGIIIADLSNAPPFVFVLFMLISFVFGYARFVRVGAGALTSNWLGMSLLFFSALNFALSVYHVGPNHINKFIQPDNIAHIYGQVVDWPTPKANHTEIILELDSVSYGASEPVSGRLIVKITDTTTAIQRNDNLEFYARIYPIKNNTTSGGSGYGRYLKLRGISGTVYLSTLLNVRIDQAASFGVFSLVDWLRQTIVTSFHRNLTPRSAALASGFLIGETRGIDPEIYRWFRDSGTLHLLAVSGSNVALVLLVALFALRPLRLSRLKRFIALLAVVGVFSLLSYGEPSVIRASLMAALILAAGLLNRRYNLNNIIAATALVILLIAPAQFYSVGFQLSFVTAWALIFVTPRVHGLFSKYHTRIWYRFLALPAIVSLIAQAASTPIILYYFERWPIWGVLANIIIVPAVSVAVVCIAGLLLVDLIWPLMGFALGSFLSFYLDGVCYMLEFFGADKSAAIVVSDFYLGLVLILYLHGFLLVLALNSDRARRLFVISSLLTMNLWLLFSLSNTLSKNDEWVLTGFKIPGGVASLIKHDAADEGDLVIGSAFAKDYPIDEVIIEPLLRKEGVKRLKRLFIMDSDFNALDDLLRLSQIDCSTTVFLDPRLLKEAIDITDDSEAIDKSPVIRSLSIISSIPVEDGYHLRGDQLKLNVGSYGILFGSVFDESELPQLVEDINLLIIGSLVDKDQDLITILNPFYFGALIYDQRQSGSAAIENNTVISKKIKSPKLHNLNLLGKVKITVENRLN